MMKGTSYLCILTAGALWGLNGLFFRILNGYGFGTTQVIFFKMLIASALIGLFLLVKNPGSFRIRLRDFWVFFGQGLISIMLFNFCYYTSMSYTTVAVTTSLLYTAPGFVVVFSVFLFREKITLRKVVALAVLFLGCMCASGVFAEKQAVTAAGIFWGVAAGFCYSFYTIFNRLALNRGYTAPTITFYSIFISALCVLPFADLAAAGSCFSPASVGYCVAIAVFTCLLPYVFYTVGMKRLEAGEAAMLATSEPVTAAIVSAVILSEPVSGFVYMGIALIIFGIVVMNLKGKSA